MDTEDIKIAIGVVGGILGIVAFMFLLIGFPVYFMAKKDCLTAYENYQPQYSFFGGCRIEWKGVLTPTKIITNINY